MRVARARGGLEGGGGPRGEGGVLEGGVLEQAEELT